MKPTGVTVRFDKSDYALLQTAAEHRGGTITDVVRFCVRQSLSHDGLNAAVERATREALAQSADLHREHVRELEELFARAGMAIAAAPPASTVPVPPTKITSPSLLR